MLTVIFLCLLVHEMVFYELKVFYQIRPVRSRAFKVDSNG